MSTYYYKIKILCKICGKGLKGVYIKFDLEVTMNI